MSERKSNPTNQGLRGITLVALALFFTMVWALPATAQNFSVQFGAQEFDARPGDRCVGDIPVSNTSEDPVTIRIFTGDWVRVPSEGEYRAVEGPGGEPRSLLNWMTYSPESMTLQPGERREINLEVNVPEDDDTLSGSYWALIYVQGTPPVDPEALPSVESEEGAIGIRTVFRYVIRVMVTIQGTETSRSATFESLGFEPIEEGFQAVARFRNDGNTHMKPSVWLELRDAAGNTVYTEEHIDITILPESVRDYMFELRGLPIESGDYLVLVIADYGAADLIAARGRVSIAITPPDEEGEAEEGDEGEVIGEEDGSEETEDEGRDDTGEDGGGGG